MCIGPGLTHVKDSRCLRRQGKHSHEDLMGDIRKDTSDISLEIHKEQRVGGAVQASFRREAGGVRRFHFRRVLVIIIYLTFYIVREISREEEEGRGGAATTATAVPNDLALMATVAGVMSRRRVYGAGSEVAHLRA
ncbi:hypothetical protein M9H77_13873 [Catharanthus roseus]|uniref:Uncharacterized protein n=1 Tax=Catharanthus roseus TaxID=4058 RepID=A0ACC0BLQ9_CATRO|nr:hypothetical protein M9H77_13873 [Catharanthus roseus]